MIEGCTRCVRSLRRPWVGALVVLATACSEEPPPQQVALVEAAPRSYSVRLDSESSDPGLFRLVEDDAGIHIQTGPAGIAYRSQDVVHRGGFHVEATFVQYDAPIGYREAYGIFVGGLDLESPDLEYTYLLVRPTGDFLIKRRIGEITETFVDWTAHEAVQRVIEEGDEPRNTLSIDVLQGETTFLVNGIAVHALPTPRVRPYGVVGIRANHRLDVRVKDWLLRAVGHDQ